MCINFGLGEAMTDLIDIVKLNYVVYMRRPNAYDNHCLLGYAHILVSPSQIMPL